MPVIYLRHEKHGTKVAFSEQEANYDEGNGWTRFDVNEPEKKDEPVNTIVRRGRKPRGQ